MEKQPLTPVELEYLRLRGMGPHDRLQQFCWIPGHPDVGERMEPWAALDWCLANPLPGPTMHALLLVVRGDSQLAALESEAPEPRVEASRIAPLRSRSSSSRRTVCSAPGFMGRASTSPSR